MNLDTSTGTVLFTGPASAPTGGTPAYTCIEGTFLQTINVNRCGNYTFGPTFNDESTTTYTGLTVSQALGGDDVSLGTPWDVKVAFGLTLRPGTGGLNPGDLVQIWNGIDPSAAMNGNMITFTVVPVPAAAWLFGSTLGLLGWMRRKTA